jgi:peptidoglycan biosynthesis protein MviN/MurJ (putative lipid II flippase)
MSFYKIAIVCSAILGIVLAPVLLKYWGIGLAMLAAGGICIAFVMLLLRAKGKDTPAVQEHTG